MTDSKLTVVEQRHLPLLSTLSLDSIRFRPVWEIGPLLDLAYQLMASQFNVDVIDPKPGYEEWLRWTQEGVHPFPQIIVVAAFDAGDETVVIGVISGNVMPIQFEDQAAAQPFEKRPYIFAIGHQVTPQILRRAGIRGIGTRLWNAGIAAAGEFVENAGGVLICSLLEAEPDSIGFWKKLGYLWPKNIRYWQPPLEFDDEGEPYHAEVPETLLIKPLAQMSNDKIDKTLLKNMIATMYENWCLHKYRQVLSESAMQRAEHLVMGKIFQRVVKSMPRGATVPLVEPPIKTAEPQQ